MPLFVPVLALLLFTGATDPGVMLGQPVDTAAEPADEDRPAEEVTYHWDGAAWTPTSRTLFTYARADEEPTLVLHQRWTDGAWADASKETWSLDAEGRQIRGETFEWTDGAWSRQAEMRFFYDDSGNKQAARRRALGDGTGADSLASTFEGALETERRFFRWQDGAWVEAMRQTSAYDADGRETARTHLVPHADGWAAQRRWTFVYEDGRRTGSTVEQRVDGAWAPWLNQTYAYSADGNPTEVVHEEWDGDGWTNMMKNETRYPAAP